MFTVEIARVYASRVTTFPLSRTRRENDVRACISEATIKLIVRAKWKLSVAVSPAMWMDTRTVLGALEQMHQISLIIDPPFKLEFNFP